jgi:hypothetical protein
MIQSAFLRRVCLLALALCSLNGRVEAQQAGILREVYENIGGSSVSDLTNNPAFPASPSYEAIAPSFEAPSDFAENYGQRMRGLITAPLTGTYYFWISSDDGSSLFLSTDSEPAKKRLIAYVSGWTASREWTKEANQKSAAITLTAGQKYYIEALQKEGGGGDNLAVRWQLPGGAIEEPIPGNRLTPVGLAAPSITAQPQSVTVVEGGQAVFTVQLAKLLGTTFQWQKNGQPVVGGTNTSLTVSPALLAESGAGFQCFITNAYGSTNTVIARMTVTPDVTRPTLVSVGSLGDPNVITLIFSEPMEAATANVAGNYALDQGAQVTAARMGQDGRTVTLTTSTLSPGVTYTATVSNVRDSATTPNTILPNSTKTFTIDSVPLAIRLLRPDPEAIGPSSRHTGLAITEIMYHPATRADGKNVEYIELYNSNPWPEDISNFRLTGAVNFTIPANTSLKALGYLVIAAAPDDVKAVYGITNVMGGFTSRLRNTPGDISLFNRLGAELLIVKYNDDFPWPASADGAGHSLVLARPSLGQENPAAWGQSDLVGGSPGKAETVGANPLRTILINEFLAHTDEPDLDFIELYNYSTSAIDISGCVITDDAGTNKFAVPAGTIISAGGFVAYDQTQLGFALSSGGETIFLKNPAGTRVLDSLKFDGQENGVSMGRFPDGAPSFRRLAAKTKGAANAKPQPSDIVINEIMFAPISDSGEDEFIELHNRSTNTVNIGRWRFTEGITYTFPLNTVMAPGSYLVVAKNVGRMLANYPNLTGANTLGNYEGSLSNDGERVALSKPDEVASLNGKGVLVTNIIHIVVDEVTYGPGGRWGKWAKGGGSSLELIDARTDKDLAPNWADSDESGKSGWTVIEHTGVLDHGSDNANSLQVMALGSGGEFLIDDVEVIPQGGSNLVPNGGFENGMASWVPQGNHERTTLANTGYNSARSLHVRGTSHGDTGANRVRVNFTSGLNAGQTVTIRARVKWIAGHPEILLRLHGNWLEATGNILTAHNFGTPGLPNSRARANAAPAITSVTHSPVLPTANQAVTVVARVNDPDGLAALVLKYRVDPSTNVTLLNMVNNGAGLYSATLPGQAIGVMAAFRIEATDNAPAQMASTFPADSATRECLVRWGETTPAGNLGTYRLWMTKRTFDRWSSREKLSNEPLDCTFVYGNSRVIYNMGGQYSGSPYHSPGFNTPTGNVCDYVFTYPEDDLFLGEGDVSMSWPGNGGGDGTYQREDTAYWIGAEIGIPFTYRRHVHLFVNGARRAEVFQDVQQPNGNMVDEYWPDGQDGDLYKIQLWFEFDDAASGFGSIGASLGNFTTTGGAKKLARYRWNWAKRAITGSANNYTNLYGLVSAVNNSDTGDTYTKRVQATVDVDNWLRTYAVEHIVGNNDSYAYGFGQNMYAYKPTGDTWKLLIWDIDFAFNASGPESDLFAVSGGRENSPDFAHPPFRRMYWQALQDAANGPLVSTRFAPILDAKYTALRAAGANVESPDSIKNFMSARRTYILGLLNTVAANFAVTSGTDYSVANNLVTLRGTAPMSARAILIDGVERPVIWTTITNWSITLALTEATNSLVVSALNKAGGEIGSTPVTVRFTGAVDAPEGKVVFNEIMYNPAAPNAGYLEILNTSTNMSYDLAGWRVEGVDFTFPVGTIIPPGGMKLIVANLDGFTAAYGAPKNYAGEYSGKLANEGETLRLLRLDAAGAPTLVVDEVTYGSVAPWSVAANGGGSSLQLIDALRDNNRVGNWLALTSNIAPAPQWQYVTASGTPNSPLLYIYMPAAGEVYVDDIKLVAGATPEVGANVVSNGDFESAFTGPWTASGIASGSSISTSVKRSGNGSLRLVSTGAGTTQSSSVWQSTGMNPGQLYTLSFWYLQNTNGGTLTFRSSGSGINTSASISPGGFTQTTRFTPGAANSTAAALPEFPTLRLNEILPNNTLGAADAAGHRHPWVEILNTGTNVANLSGLYLSASPNNPLQWALPGGSLGPGAFAFVWLDGHPEETTVTEWHANFAAAPGAGSLVLTRVAPTATNVVDFLNYTNLVANQSFGDFGDGIVSNQRTFYYPTPGAPNDGRAAPISVVINEWMADNTESIADPADNKFQDWFELLNKADQPADLSGYYLTDTVANKTKFRVPAGFVIPAGGRLLVWADDEVAQNSALGTGDLHVNFALGKSGEAIGLYSPEQVVIDLINFGPQTSDISQGRFPDGAASIFFMTNITPRLPNRLTADANAAPQLVAPADQSLWEGQPLSVTFTATDADLPAQALFFSLDGPVPDGATINSDSGLLTWRAPAVEAATVVDFGVRVTDSGSPTLSDTVVFQVTVLPRPRLASVAIDVDTIAMRWNVIAGRRYQTQFTDNLELPNWVNVGEAVSAAGAQITVNDPIQGDRRFYRLVEAP